MVILNSVEIIEYRAELAGDADALRALDMIEDCEGDLEDAAIALALHDGQEPDINDGWLEGFAKRWRTVICGAELREAIDGGSIAEALRLLRSETSMPRDLATPVALYVLKTGVAEFCQPLAEKL